MNNEAFHFLVLIVGGFFAAVLAALAFSQSGVLNGAIALLVICTVYLFALGWTAPEEIDTTHH